MKLLLLVLIFSCSVLKPRNFNYIELGNTDQEVQKDFYVEDIFDSPTHRFIGLSDGIIVTDKKKVIGKIQLQQDEDLPVKVQSLSTGSTMNGNILIESDGSIDSKTILWKNVKRMVRTVFELQGSRVVENAAEANHILRVNYNISRAQTTTITQGLLLIRKDIIYTKKFSFALANKSESDSYVWETHVQIDDAQEDLNMIIPGMISAASRYMNKPVSGTQEFTITRGNVLKNILQSPNAFESYILANKN